MDAPDYVELHALSAFSFQRGASKPDELAGHALDIGYRGIAITDECSMAGVVRAHTELKERERLDWPLIIGSEFTLYDGPKFVLLAETQRGYAGICERITRGRRFAEKGTYRLGRADFDEAIPDICVLWIPRGEHELDELDWLRERYAGRLWIAVELHRDGDDAAKLSRLQELGRRFGIPCVASGDVHMHVPERKALQDVMTALRHRTTVGKCGQALFANGERYLRSQRTLQVLYPPELLRETLVIAGRCRFRLGELKYEYPREIVAEGHTPTSYLRHLVKRHLPERWPIGAPFKVRRELIRELRIIAKKGYEAFFLTVYEIVEFAKRQAILCQGRGSAANSAVCYVLGITEVSPEFNQLLFERFVSIERDEPPDIDVDFEHERREEVIQHVYRKYGRERTAIAATVICYRSRSALRDAGRALGVGEEIIERVAKSLAWWDRSGDLPNRLRKVGVDPESRTTRLWLELAIELKGFPRHLSQHVGGFVISDEPLSQLVPVENAAMPDRTIIQWDKDDLESLGLLKVDVLALGMLSALRRSFDLHREYKAEDRLALRNIPPNDADTYAMIGRAETIGVFQIESRAQMSMLPRLRPKNLYDITVQVAIVRPGPIQGGMVHPYLQNRLSGIKPSYPSKEVEDVLDRTHGVPIFQEQVMQLVVVAAGFTAGEADRLRRSMAAWKRSGGLEEYEQKIKDGMAARKYPAEFADRIYKQILGFGSYGFPESHAASFALLAYISAYMKCHYPAAFIAGLVNAYPMGFYPPSMLITEARRMGVEVNPVDVQRSRWDCHLERGTNDKAAIRLGMRLVAGFNEEAGLRVEHMRGQQPYENVDDLARRAQLSRRELDVLAAADALRPLTGHRFQARWQTKGFEKLDGVLEHAPVPDDPATLSAPREGEDILADYQSTGLTLRRHPVALLRERLVRGRVTANGDLHTVSDGHRIRVAGVVMFRQRPGSAEGVMFMTLEDDTGIVNLIIRPKLIEEYREAVVGGQFLIAQGLLQRQSEVTHVIAEKFHDRSHWVGELPYLSRDFR